MPDRELDVPDEYGYGTYYALHDAIDLASSQGTTTWLTRDGKRIAKIAPAGEVLAPAASAFTALSTGERRAAVLGRFYGNLRGPKPGKTEA